MSAQSEPAIPNVQIGQKRDYKEQYGRSTSLEIVKKPRVLVLFISVKAKLVCQKREKGQAGLDRQDFFFQWSD